MSASALTMMLIVQVFITGVTFYFFLKVLLAPPKPEPDSYKDNDPA